MSIEVVDPGPLTTIQDLGRVGLAHLGVPRAGAADRGSADLANRLVGNPADAAVLETTMGGVTLRPLRAVTLAVTGATCEVRCGGRAAAHGLPLTVPAGTVVEVGPASQGVRSYVAFAGGLVVEPVLGSRSTDTLAWVGPPPLAAGQRLPVGVPASAPAPVDAAPSTQHPRVLTLVRGPRADWMDDDAWRALDGSVFSVGAASDRVGLRLEGPVVRRATSRELASEGMVLGAVQLPPSGQPIVFLADHPTTGGYPVIGLVGRRQLDACAQWRPGEQVTVRVDRSLPPDPPR